MPKKYLYRNEEWTSLCAYCEPGTNSALQKCLFDIVCSLPMETTKHIFVFTDNYSVFIKKSDGNNAHKSGDRHTYKVDDLVGSGTTPFAEFLLMFLESCETNGTTIDCENIKKWGRPNERL